MLTLIRLLTLKVNPEMASINTLCDTKPLQIGVFSSRGVNAVNAVSAKTESSSYFFLRRRLFGSGLTGLTGLTPSTTGLELANDVVAVAVRTLHNADETPDLTDVT